MNSDNPSTKETDYSITEEVDVDFFMEYIEQNPISSTPRIAPVAPTHPGSIAQDGFRHNDPSVFDYGYNCDFLSSESFMNHSDGDYDQTNMYTSSDSVPGQSALDRSQQGGYNHWNAGNQHHSETNVAFGAPNNSSQSSAQSAAGTNSFYNDELTQMTSKKTPDPVRTLSPSRRPYMKRPTSVVHTPSMGHIPPWNNITSPVLNNGSVYTALPTYRPTGTHGPATFHGPATLQAPVLRTSAPFDTPLMNHTSAPPHEAVNYQARAPPYAPEPQRAPGPQYAGLRHPPVSQRVPGLQRVSEPQRTSTPSHTSTTPGTLATHRPPVTNHHAPVTHHTPATGDSPAPHQSENDDAGDGEQAAVDADAANATHKRILAIEKQARTAMKKFKSKISIAGQMGESITLARTNTGVEFGGTMWTAPANDVTVPATDKEIKARVDVLERAMRNTENIREKADIGSSTNRWNPNSDYYFPEEFNAAAGLLVKEMINIHTNGWTKPIFDKTERDQCQVTMFYTFEDRFEGLRDLLHHSKTSVQDIMKGSRFFTIIANPRLLINRTATNKTANVNKGNQIKAGKKALENGSSAGASSNDEDKDDGAKHQGGEERSNSEELKVKKASKGKKRAQEETFVVEDPAGQPPRKKAAAKKRRSA